MKFILSFLIFSVIFSDCANIPKRNRGPKILPYKLNHVKYIEASKSDPGAPVPRLYGGQSAPEGKFKFMIFSMYCPEENFERGVFSCSASLIKEDLVLLAAHCFAENLTPKSSSVILAGGKADLNSYVRERLKAAYTIDIEESKHKVQERRANHIYVNERYNVETKEHDIALIRLQKPFDIGRTVLTIPLSYDEMRSSMDCTILGWGLSENNTRNYLLMYSDNMGAQTVKEGCEYKSEGDFICLQRGINIGICHGDSGSPLVCGGRVWGVASHLVSYEDAPDCGKDLEEYYTELFPNAGWVKDTLGQPYEPEPTAENEDRTAGSTATKTLPSIAAIIFLIFIFR